MNTLHPHRRQPAGRMSGLTNAILGLLLVAGLVQIGLCFWATVGLVPPADRIVSATESRAYVTNTPTAVHPVIAAPHEKS